MIELLHKVLLWIHLPFGFISLVLFWIPVGVKKGSSLHRKVGKYYYRCMWIVVVTAFLMSLCNLIMANYVSATFLGYLAIITAYPLWYSYEILQQDKVWSDRYFLTRKIFTTVLFLAGISMLLLGGIKYQFKGIGTLMGFFGLLVLPAGRELLQSREKAMHKESKLKMHIQGTIVSGIAAYTAFLAFGGRRILVEVFQLDGQWMIIPWIGPTVLGLVYSWFMKRKYVKER
ncbi:MAG: hypothetical protein AAGA31_16930 [Bacteroidota bacterium]